MAVFPGIEKNLKFNAFVFQKNYTFGVTNCIAVMKNLSLKLQDAIFSETEALVGLLKKNRNAYMNEALAFYNRYQKRRLLAEQLRRESAMVADSSMEVLSEFEVLDDFMNEN